MVYYLIAVVAMTIIGESFPMSKLQLLLLFLLYGLAIGGILFAILLPFMILVAKSGFFRDRLFACMRLKSMEAVSEPDVVVELEGLSADADNEIQPPGQDDPD